jgi:hypothetical protein
MRNGLSWGKKQKNCDLQNPEDKTKGDQWDHTGIDVPSRFVVSMVIGKRSKDNVKKVVADFADRTGNVPPELITTDDCSSYADAFLEQYGETIIPEKTGARGRPRKPFKRMPEGAVYATVNKENNNKGTVPAVFRKLFHGTEEDSSPEGRKGRSQFYFSVENRVLWTRSETEGCADLSIRLM